MAWTLVCHGRAGVDGSIPGVSSTTGLRRSVLSAYSWYSGKMRTISGQSASRPCVFLRASRAPRSHLWNGTVARISTCWLVHSCRGRTDGSPNLKRRNAVGQVGRHYAMALRVATGSIGKPSEGGEVGEAVFGGGSEVGAVAQNASPPTLVRMVPETF